MRMAPQIGHGFYLHAMLRTTTSANTYLLGSLTDLGIPAPMMALKEVVRPLSIEHEHMKKNIVQHG